MADATAPLNTSSVPVEKNMGGQYLDSTQEEYFNGTCLQTDGSTDEVVSAGTSVEGTVVGFCAGNYDYAGTETDRTLELGIAPAFRSVTIAGAAATKKGYPVYATDDQTFTITYASGAKLVGFLWYIKGQAVLCDIGFLNRFTLGLAGTEKFTERYVIPATLLTTGFHLAYTAPRNQIVTGIDITNIAALDASADLVFTYEKNASATPLGTHDIDSVGERAVNATADIIATGGTELVTGNTIDIYTKTVTSTPTAGMFLIEVSGINRVV